MRSNAVEVHRQHLKALEGVQWQGTRRYQKSSTDRFQ